MVTPSTRIIVGSLDLNEIGPNSAISTRLLGSVHDLQSETVFLVGLSTPFLIGPAVAVMSSMPIIGSAADLAAIEIRYRNAQRHYGVSAERVED